MSCIYIYINYTYIYIYYVLYIHHKHLQKPYSSCIVFTKNAGPRNPATGHPIDRTASRPSTGCRCLALATCRSLGEKLVRHRRDLVLKKRVHGIPTFRHIIYILYTYDAKCCILLETSKQLKKKKQKQQTKNQKQSRKKKNKLCHSALYSFIF